jgi:hypothetical protein
LIITQVGEYTLNMSHELKAPRIFSITPDGELFCVDGSCPKQRLKEHYEKYMKDKEDKTIAVISSDGLDYLLMSHEMVENMGA